MTKNSGLSKAFDSLNERQQKFVLHWVDSGSNSRRDAMVAAGYEWSSEDAMRVMAHRVFTHKGVQQAIRDLTLARLAAAGPMLTEQLLFIAREGEKESDRLKAIGMIADRIGMHAVSEHHVKTEDISTTREAMQRELEMLLAKNPEARALLPGPLQKMAPAIEVEFVEVDPDAELLDL